MDIIALTLKDHAMNIVFNVDLLILELDLLLHKWVTELMVAFLEEFEFVGGLLGICGVEFVELVDCVALGDVGMGGE